MNNAPLSTHPTFSGAGFGIRLAARLIDAFYGLCLGLVGGILAGTILVVLETAGFVSPGWPSRVEGWNLTAFVFSFAGSLLCVSLLEGMHGATLGKLACRLRVVTEEAKPIGMKAAIRRSLAFYFDGLFFGLVGYSAMKDSPLNQRYGDRWAHTVVIKSQDLPAGSDRGIGNFLAALVLGTTCWILLLSAGIILQAT